MFRSELKRLQHESPFSFWLISLSLGSLSLLVAYTYLVLGRDDLFLLKLFGFLLVILLVALRSRARYDQRMHLFRERLKDFKPKNQVERTVQSSVGIFDSFYWLPVALFISAIAIVCWVAFFHSLST